MDIDITVENGNLVVKTPFSWDFVNSIKKDVPSHAKKFDGTRKVLGTRPQLLRLACKM